MTVQRIFNHNWTDDRLPLWMPHIQHLVGKEHTVYFEIGSFEGRSTCWMFDNVLTHPTSRSINVDPFMPVPTFGFTEQFRSLFFHNTQEFGPRITPVVAISSDAWPMLPTAFRGQQADLIYVDGSHETDDVLHDAAMAWKYSKKGTVIVFDDYDWTDVRKGVDAWLSAMGERVSVLHVAYQIIVRREV